MAGHQGSAWWYAVQFRQYGPEVPPLPPGWLERWATEPMPPPTGTLRYQDLESAVEWSSSGAPFEHTALLSRATGEVFFTSLHGDFGDDLPKDIEDGTLYVAAPHKNDLDLGRKLVFDFMESVAPRHVQLVESYFRQRGAYSKFKALLECESLLDDWYKFESKATCEAILKWALENGFNVIEIPSAATPAVL